MDTTIMVGENLYKNHPEYKVEAAFFLSAAWGFKGRLYSDEERKNGSFGRQECPGLPGDEQGKREPEYRTVVW
jgi:hypothetical protein